MMVNPSPSAGMEKSMHVYLLLECRTKELDGFVYCFCVHVNTLYLPLPVHRTRSGAFKDEESADCNRRSHSRRWEQTQKEEKIKMGTNKTVL